MGALDKEHTAIDLSEFSRQTIQIAMEVYASHSGDELPPCTRAALPADVPDFPDDVCQKQVKDGSRGGRCFYALDGYKHPL